MSSGDEFDDSDCIVMSALESCIKKDIIAVAPLADPAPSNKQPKPAAKAAPAKKQVIVSKRSTARQQHVKRLSAKKEKDALVRDGVWEFNNILETNFDMLIGLGKREFLDPTESTLLFLFNRISDRYNQKKQSERLVLSSHDLRTDETSYAPVLENTFKLIQALTYFAFNKDACLLLEGTGMRKVHVTDYALKVKAIERKIS
jgi:hypothetical protein